MSCTDQDSRFFKRAPVDISFEDVTLTIAGKNILDHVSGRFSHGELTAIIGSSGAGKSTLMDILTGYRTSYTHGKIYINNESRNLNKFHNLSCYIMQDDLLQPGLSVWESLEIAASLKLGPDCTVEERTIIINKVLTSIGLHASKDTRIEKISGGEQKRLAIALELVNDPPILFLDEPTSGLDYHTSKQCINILQMLARQGRTIVCSIHQPSASILNNFDQLFVMAHGQCVYQGKANKLVPFLSSFGYICPILSNPADYVIEATDECPKNVIAEMAEENKKSFLLSDKNLEKSSKSSSSSFETNDLSPVENTPCELVLQSEFLVKKNLKPYFFHSTKVLLRRMFLQQIRAKIQICLSLSVYIMGGLMMGMIFYNIAKNTRNPLMHLNFVLVCIVFTGYTQVGIPILLYPYEVKVFKREHFNNWYSLNSYYLALTLSKIPSQIILSSLFVIVPYYFSGHPMEIERIFSFWLISIAISFVSEGYGFAIGSIFSAKAGAILANAFITPILVLALQNIGSYYTSSIYMKMLMSTSFVRLGVVGLLLSLFDNRLPLKCEEEFCYFTDPKIILRYIGAEGQSIYAQIVGLVIIWIVYKLIAYLALYYRSSPYLKHKLSTMFLKMKCQ